MTTTTMTAEEWRKKNPGRSIRGVWFPATAQWSGDTRRILTVTIQIPDRCLSPNSRAHWAKVAKHKKAMRSVVCAACKWWETEPRWKAATLQAFFYWPDRRHRDDDNAMASLKSARDGLADAGIVVNDRVFTTLPAAMWYDKENPRVEIVVKEAKP